MNLANKVINVLGDSITECAYLEQEKSFCSLLARKNNCKVRNYGVGGTCISPSYVPNKENPIYDENFLMRFDLMNHDADILIVYGGTNDYGHGDSPFGSFFDQTKDTFLGSLRILCEKIKKTYRDKLVIFITPLRRENDIRKNPNLSKGELSYKLENYVNYIKYYAQIYGFECIDFFHELQINPNKIEDKLKFTMDGLHPNELGHKIIAEKISDFLNNYEKINLNDGWKVIFSTSENISDKKYEFETSLPNSMENILFENGIEGHPYFGTNTWNYQKYEGFHQFYIKKFPKSYEGKTLTFEGIDTISEIYINGKLLLKTDNMFIPYSLVLKNLKEENELIVHILPAVVEGKKKKLEDYVFANKYNYESLNLRKSPCSFGWDIFLRCPLGGIWKNVLVDDTNYFKDFLCTSELINDDGLLNLDFGETKFEGDIKITCMSNDSYYEFNSKFQSKISFTLNNVKKWNVVGYGEPNLYQVIISLHKNNKIYEKKIKIGFRNVRLNRSSKIEINGKFEFVINNKKVFILGTNWVPVDALKHIDKDRMFKALEKVVDLGCNAIRVWGGGVYECQEFYEFCDEHGILVWQDFMMGCAIYPQDNEFINNIKNEINFVVRDLSHHPSICLWAGDNECDVACQWAGDKINPNTNIITRKIIPSILKVLDKNRPYLPSSPYEDEEGYKNYNYLPEDHLWGPRDYFRGDYYNNAKTYFVSETGYHGCPDEVTLKKFISNVWPMFSDGKPTDEYLAHATSVEKDDNSPYAFRIKLMFDQVSTLFNQHFDNVNDFALASQISQAEALKFFIEKMRTYEFGSGIIWWNLLDGWYQISDSIINYDFNEKLAYQYIKKSQEKVLLSFREIGDEIVLFGSNISLEDANITYSINNGINGSVLLQKESLLEIARFKSIKKKYYEVKYSINKTNERVNHFVSDIKGISFVYYIKNIKNIYSIKEAKR